MRLSSAHACCPCTLQDRRLQRGLQQPGLCAGARDQQRAQGLPPPDGAPQAGRVAGRRFQEQQQQQRQPESALCLQATLIRCLAALHRPPRLPQVSSTAEINVGDWVRIYALAPSPARRLGRRRLAAAAGTAQGLVRPRPAGHAGNASAVRAAAEPGVLPLTEALARQMEAAQEYYVDEIALDIGSAARPGTLDAYLYGENMVFSGKSEWGAQGPSAQAQVAGGAPHRAGSTACCVCPACWVRMQLNPLPSPFPVLLLDAPRRLVQRHRPHPLPVARGAQGPGLDRPGAPAAL